MKPDLTGGRVVVVEGHDDSRDIYEQALSFCGATVLAVHTAREVLAIYNYVRAGGHGRETSGGSRG